MSYSNSSTSTTLELEAQYRSLHEISSNYGTSSIRYLPEIRLIIDYLEPKTVLDFGCGKASLIKILAKNYPKIEFYGFDPAIPGRDTLPVEKADLIINTDVLEHIPEDILPDVIKKIASISNNVYFALHHGLAKTILPNGENAHCTVKPPQWYYDLLSRHFKTPYPLPYQGLDRSALITFSPTVEFLDAYQKIIFPPPSLEDISNHINKIEAQLRSFEDASNKINGIEKKINVLHWNLRHPLHYFFRKLRSKILKK